MASRIAAGTATAAALAAMVAGCGGSEPPAADDAGAATSASPTAAATGTGADAMAYPELLEATLSPTGDSYTISVTISSPYDSADRYADGWRVLAPDGTVLGTHTLLHPHQNEQPFTRTQSGLAIPDGVEEVTVEGRDSVNGFGGATLTVTVPSG